MNQQPRQLDQLQRWMQAVITWPGEIQDGITSPDAQSAIPLSPDELESVITRSSQQTSEERIGIYANAYYARLLECLSEEYPALIEALGETAFAAFCLQYLQTCPSTSYTLGDLGARFPQFLAENRPEREETGTPDWTDFLIELATLERLYSEVFDGPGIEQAPLLTPETLNAISPEAWPELKLQMAPCFRLCQFQFPVHEYITSVRKEEAPSIPEPETTYLAITRRNFVVRRETVSEPEYFLLSRLQQGQRVGEAIAELVEADFPGTDELATQLRQWFAHWTAAAFIIGLSSVSAADEGPETQTAPT